MAKNSIRDYSATNSANTDIQSIDISEGCSPAGINNAIREVMADLKDVSTGAVALESPAFDSASLTGDLTFGDNDKAVFGAGSDLQIYHNGTSASYITDQGTGNLVLGGDSAIILQNAAHNSNMIDAYNGGRVGLYHAGNLKLATTASGCDVTGGLNTTGNVGIGTTSPSTWNTKLVVYNDQLTVTGGGYDGTFADSIYFGGNGEGTTYRNKISNSLSSTATNQMMKFSIANGASTWVDVMTLNGSGNVGIGASPASKLTVVSATGGGISIAQGTENFYGASLHRFYTDGYASEVVRIDSSGNLLVGTSSTTSAGKIKIETNDEWTIGSDVNNGTTSKGHIAFYNPNGLCGYISTSGTSTAYNTSSDYRLKENVTADWDATTRLKQLNPVRFNFIADADTTVDGFLAHEVQTVVPEAISGTKDAMMDEEYTVSAATGDIYTPAIEAVLDEDGNEATPAVAEVIHSTDVERPEELAGGQQWRETTAAVMGTRSVPNYQGIDQSKLVPLLVKTIQELEARITALEAN